MALEAISHDTIHRARFFQGAPATIVKDYTFDPYDYSIEQFSSIVLYDDKPDGFTIYLIPRLENERLWNRDHEIFMETKQDWRNAISLNASIGTLSVSLTITNLPIEALNIGTKTKGYLTDNNEISNEDIIFDIPPIKRYPIKGRVKSVKKGELKLDTECDYLLSDDDILSEDRVVHFPPLKKYTVKARIKNTRKGELKIHKSEDHL